MEDIGRYNRTYRSSSLAEKTHDICTMISQRRTKCLTAFRRKYPSELNRNGGKPELVEGIQVQIDNISKTLIENRRLNFKGI
jgi:hypothetical protein